MKENKGKGCQYKLYGKTHYQRNKRYYIERARQARRRQFDFIVDYKKAHPCVDCGIDDWRVLDFDHLPEFVKKGNMGELVHAGCGLKTLKDEIEKCEVRCANCHRIKTFERRMGM